MKIVFMGTAAFAVPILQKLVNSKHKVVAVYTKRFDVKSRNIAQKKSLVNMIADSANIPIYTPKSFKNQLIIDEFLKIDADIAVVAAYGLILPQPILDAFNFGFINIHPSDLPRWRGAAPIQRSMMAGDDTTAVCIIKMDSGIDTGPVYAKKQLVLDKTKNIHQLTEEYARIGSELLLDTLEKIEQNNYSLSEQTQDGASYAVKIQPQDEIINFNHSAAEVHGKIMALTPTAHFEYKGLHIKAIESLLTDKTSDAPPCTVISKQLEVVCGDNRVVKLTKLQRSGGKILDTQAFLCGYKIPIGTTLT